MDMSKVSSRELLEALKGRDLFAEVGQEKADWLYSEGILPMPEIAFWGEHMNYTLGYVMDKSLDELKQKYYAHKNDR